MPRALVALAATLGAVASAGAAPPLPFPPIVLGSAAGTQLAVQGSGCVSTQGTSVCADTAFPHPRSLTVAAAGSELTVSVRAAKVTDGTVQVFPLGCPSVPIATLTLGGDTLHWTVGLPPGAYELLVFARFASADGSTSGDTSGGLGLLVDPNGSPAIVPLSRALRPGQVSGGSEAQRAALLQVFRGLGLSLRFQGSLSGNTLCLLGAAASGAELVRARWEGVLAAGAFAARSRALGLPAVRAFTTVLLGSERLRQRDGGSVALTSANPRSVSTAAILAAARPVIRARGVVDAEVTFLRPLAWAPVVDVRTRDPQGFAASGELSRLIARLTGGRRPPSEGALVRVRDANGRLVREVARTVRLARTLAWRAAR